MQPKMPHENHNKHMCYLVNIKMNFPELKSIAKDAKYICKNCARVAKEKEYLCKPIKL
jgi:hypothetical protein